VTPGSLDAREAIQPLPRRDFLKTAAAAALVPALPAWGRAPAVRSFSFAYFSDTAPFVRAHRLASGPGLTSGASAS
jgi:hypothetical protein